MVKNAQTHAMPMGKALNEARAFTGRPTVVGVFGYDSDSDPIVSLDLVR